MKRELNVKCQKCDKKLLESKHIHFPTETSNVFKVKCINKECSEFCKIHVVMEAKLKKRE